MAKADHARRPRGLAKTGGRSRGTLNKATQARILGFAPPELVKPAHQQPLEFLLSVMEDESHPIATRVDAAKAAAPYVHFRKGMVDQAGRDQPITVQVIRFSDMTSKLEPVTIEHDSNEAA
jgi:hypothetical protein